MSKQIDLNIDLNGYDSGDTSTTLNKLTATASATAVDWVENISGSTLGASSGAIDYFPAHVSSGDIQVVVSATYSTEALATKELTAVVDGASILVKDLGAFSCNTSLTIANADATYDAVIDVFYYIKS